MWRRTISVFVFVVVASVHCLADFSRGDIPSFDGRGLPAGEQCKYKNYGGVCKTPNLAERCVNLKCADTRGDIPIGVNIGPALMETSCGDNKICVYGECIEDPNPFQNPVVTEDFQYSCEDYPDYYD